MPDARRAGNGPVGADRRTWRAILREERERLGMTQTELAKRVGLGEDTVRKYESGARIPTRAALERMLDVLAVPVATAREAMLDRGFHHEGFRFPPERSPRYYFSAEELAPFLEDHPWPAFVANELTELVAANRLAQALWGVDVASEQARRTRAGANLFAVLGEPRFVERIANWDEVLRTFVGVLKGVKAGRAMLDEPGGLFGDVFGELVSANPTLLATLYRAWESTPARPDKSRWAYRVVWREPGFGEMRFVSLVTPASETEAWAFNDWVPADAGSHAALDVFAESRGLGPGG